VANKTGFADQELSYKAIERLITTLSLARGGDFNVRMAADGDGVEREVADSLNELLGMISGFTSELERVSEGVTQGELRARMPLDKGNGGWGQQLRAINNIVVVFGKHVAELRRVVKAIHTGDMARPMNVGPEATHRGGELARAAEDINAMITHLAQVTAEITRVFAEVGLDGRLNTQCHISDASGSWGLLVGSVNAASASLAEQVQDLCATAQALSAGNLSARASTASRGDLQTLKTGLNGAADGLGALCIELRRVCQEVTSEGKLVAEMRHPNPVGEWQSAQESVNRMLQKLAATVRSAAEHAERVLQGDYSPAPEAPSNGELGAPARVIELLSRQQEDVQQGLTALIDGRFEDVPVRGDTQRELTLAQLSLRLKRDFFRSIRATIMEVRSSSASAQEFDESALSAVLQSVGAVAGAYYTVQDQLLVRVANLGCEPQASEMPLRIGEGLVGKAAHQGEPLLLDDLDERGLRIRSGLLELTPRAVLLFPLQRDGRTIGVFELLFVNSSAITARELLDYLAEELVRGPELRANDNHDNPRVRALEEELVIANTRLERMAAELQNRERTVRATGT
jgi:HAMP domain-containing protein